MTRTAWIVGTCACALLGVVMLMVVGFALRLPEPRTDTPIPLRVDAGLTGDGAWISDRDVAPSVLVTPIEDGSISVMVAQVSTDETERIELTLSLGRGAEVIGANVIWYGDDMMPFFGPYELAHDLRGAVTIDADRPPAIGDDRILAYELHGTRDDQPVALRGEVRIAYAAK